MSLWQRISLIFRSKANKALDRAEDPRETLDYSYQRQLELLVEGTPRASPTWPPAASAWSSRSTSSSSSPTKLQDQAQKAHRRWAARTSPARR